MWKHRPYRRQLSGAIPMSRLVRGYHGPGIVEVILCKLWNGGM